MSSETNHSHHTHHSHRSHHRRKKISGTRKKLLIIIPSVIVGLVLIAAALYFIIRSSGQEQLRTQQVFEPKMPQYTSELVPEITAGSEVTTEVTPLLTPVPIGSSLPTDADVYFGGKAYNYKDNLINILLLGVDKKSDSDDAHQADAIYVVVVDENSNSVDVVAISRNTMTDVDLYDVYGQYYSTRNMQLCMAYSFGQDDTQSSEITKNAVSNLLYGLPISGYYTLFMDSVPIIVDSVGGVPVTMDEDMTDISDSMVKGANVLLDGKMALGYIRSRSGTNELRLQHQKTFLSSFMKVGVAAVKKNLSLPLSMYNTLSGYSATDIGADSAVYLATLAVNADFRGFTSLPGTVGTDGTHETYEVNEDQLYTMMLDIFYEEAK